MPRTAPTMRLRNICSVVVVFLWLVGLPSQLFEWGGPMERDPRLRFHRLPISATQEGIEQQAGLRAYSVPGTPGATG